MKPKYKKEYHCPMCGSEAKIRWCGMQDLGHGSYYILPYMEAECTRCKYKWELNEEE